MTTDPRIDALVSTLSRLAALDFSARSEVSDVGDEVDAVVAGVNMLAEELEASTVSRDEVQKREDRLSATFGAVLDPLIVIDGKGIIERVNEAAEKLFGHQSGELVGRNVKVLMPEPHRGDHDGHLEQYLLTGEARAIGNVRQLEGIRANGEVFPIELSVAEIPDSDGPHFVGQIRDISERLKIDRMKSEFVSVVSHELRTPLTSIRGSLGLLTEGVTGPLPERARKMVEIALRNTQRLVRLVNDILDVERIAEGKLAFDYKRVGVPQLVSEVIEGHTSLADEKGLTLAASVSDDADWVMGDPDRLTQAVTNLLANAIVFSPAGATVTVAAVRGDGAVIFSVRDEGPGIPPEFHSRLFDRFAQADSSSRRTTQGSGLGLNIAKAIVEHHGGTIWFDTGPAKGTTMFFSVPRPEAHASRSSEHTGQKVLICEDDADAAEVLRAILESHDWACDVVADADTAEEKLGSGEYGVLLLDLGLEGRDGMSLIRSLRSSGLGVPVIVVSGAADVASRRLGSELVEVVDWIQKPVSPHRLCAAFELGLARRASPTALVVEDDPDLRELVASQLGDDVQILWAETLAEGRAALREHDISIVVLDVGLPDGSGLDLLQDLRGPDGETIPVVVFSATELGPAVRAQVSAALVKSRASMQQLVDTVRNLLPSKG